MTWMFIISTTIWVNGWDTSSVASRARSELTSSQCNWKGNRKGKGTDETPLVRLQIDYFFWKYVWSYKGIKFAILPVFWKLNKKIALLTGWIVCLFNSAAFHETVCNYT